MMPREIPIRPEGEADHSAIFDLTRRAFAPMRFAAGNEQALIGVLRELGALSLSLVAEHEGEVVGHVALSPVTHECGEAGWFGLGPISVKPTLQRQGVGGALFAEAKRTLSALEARGCILTGDPNYYPRYGFLPAPQYDPEAEPPEYFMVLSLSDGIPDGHFRFHPAFSA